MLDPVQADAQDGQALSLAVSSAMVKIYKQQFGRGPTTARTSFAGPDVLICTLEESFTAEERRLVELDEHEWLRDFRTFFQHAAEAEFRGVVEELTGRRVRGFVSGVDTHADVAAEVFYLE